MTAWQLRNADMHSFEAARQQWRGTAREYADAGGADLAHKLASVVDGVFRILRGAEERHPRRNGIPSAVSPETAASDAAVAERASKAAYARLHPLKHAFPGGLNDLCSCVFAPCACEGPPRKDRDDACCERAETFNCLLYTSPSPRD